MTKFSSLLSLFFVLTIFSYNLFAQKTGLLKDKHILFVYGGWDGHNPEGCKALLVPWLESEGANVHTSNTLDVYSDSELISNLDLIIHMWTMGQITKEQSDGLLSAVRSGVGIAGWHGGLGDSFRNNLHFQWMVGGQFLEHPGGIIPYTVHISNPEDPITRGLKDFTTDTEQYYMLVDPNIEVLASTTFSGEHENWIEGHTMPVVWKKHFGKGRVFYISLGHKVEDFEVPEMITILKRGIVWAAGSKDALR